MIQPERLGILLCLPEQNVDSFGSIQPFGDNVLIAFVD
jgi:hypothetical protein